MSAPRITVLLSAGRHPLSGRPRRAPNDARALEMALRLPPDGPTEIDAVHAGDSADPALRDYLGMGLKAISVLEVPPGADPTLSLVEWLGARDPDLILSGLRAESTDGSGFLPYLIAERLCMPIAQNICGIELEDGAVRMVQALPGGQRRVLQCATPLVVTVGAPAPAPRQSAYARARSGKILTVPGNSAEEATTGWTEVPVRRRPKRTPDLGHLSGPERLAALTRMRTGSGQVLTGLGADQAARALYDYLRAVNILGDTTTE